MIKPFDCLMSTQVLLSKRSRVINWLLQRQYSTLWATLLLVGKYITVLLMLLPLHFLIPFSYEQQL